MKLKRQQIIILTCILLAGFFIRWGACAYITGPPIQAYPTMDEMNFRELARNVLEHRTFATWTEGFYTTSTRAPVYPLMIASAYFLADSKSYAVPKTLNLIFDMLNIFLIFILAGSLFREKMGLIAAGIYAFFGHAPYFMGISSPHTLGLMLLLLVCIALTNIRERYWLSTICLGFFYTLLIHTRPVFLVATPFLFIAIWFQLASRKNPLAAESPKKQKRFRWLWNNWKGLLWKSIIPVALVFLLCLPWGIRNYQQHKTIVPVCIIAGWHIASNENDDLKLSIKYLSSQLYAPERKGFTEGQYFQAARKKMFKSFFANPFRFVKLGFGRLFYGWSPPGPFYRFLLPKAYFFPIKIFNGFIVPLPDFEGMLYLFILSSIILLFLSGGKVFAGWLKILYRTRVLVVIIIGYTLAHLLGIPLISYRFLIEPLLIIILLGIAGLYVDLLLEKYPQLAADSKSYTAQTANWLKIPDKPENKILCKTTLLVFMASLIIFMLLPLMHTPVKEEKTYFAPLLPHGIKNYQQVRNQQWNNLGNIAPDTLMKVQGIVRYLHPGFKYIENDYYSVKAPGTAAARLYIQYGEAENQLGIGDVRLNFKTADIPKDGQMIMATGKAKVGLFKEIIIDVMDFKDLYPLSTDSKTP